ncbi:putative solute carrier family 13 [Helianthus debilis subsp. tardiflorus]
MLRPLHVGAWAFVCLMITVMTKTLTVKDALSGFTNDVIWLIVVSFFFNRGFVKTGLGDRLAMYFFKWFGKSTLRLAYGLAIGENIISPAMPSATVRAGGIFLHIINSLAIASGSSPHDGSARKLGAYLIQSQLKKCNEEVYDAFSKFTFTTDAELSVRKAMSELDSWLARAESGLVDDLERLPYVCAAMEQLEERNIGRRKGILMGPTPVTMVLFTQVLHQSQILVLVMNHLL